MTRIYRYIVRYDAGCAPNPFDGICTLAICKPAIRRTARVGDWVLGFRSQRHREIVYAMQVSEVLSFPEYWRDPRFFSRRPGQSNVPTDNIYRPARYNGRLPFDLRWVPNDVHDEGQLRKDVSGKNVLVSARYWYFGQKSKALPESLLKLAPATQGHVVHKHRIDGDLAKLEAWLSRFAEGMLGAPIDIQLASDHLMMSPGVPHKKPRSCQSA